MSDQEHEKADCSVCNGSGITWNWSNRSLCSICDGAGQLTPDEMASRLQELANQVASLPGTHGEFARFQAALARQTDAASELEFLKTERELRASLKPTHERLARRAAAIARVEEQDRLEEEQARLEEELKERYGPELYGLYESGRYSREEADRISAKLSKR